MGVSVTTTAIGAAKHKRQEGSLVPHDSAAGVGSDFYSLTPSSLFSACLSTAQSCEKVSADN